MVWESPGCLIFRPNGRASAKCSASPLDNQTVEPVSALAVSVSGKRDLGARETGARKCILLPLAASRDSALTQKATNPALFSMLWEISRFERVRGGGRSRSRTCLLSQIPC